MLAMNQLLVYTTLRRRSGFEKGLTIKNCDKIFLKNILRLKIAKKQRHFDVSKRHYQVKNMLLDFRSIK